MIKRKSDEQHIEAYAIERPKNEAKQEYGILGQSQLIHTIYESLSAGKKQNDFVERKHSGGNSNYSLTTKDGNSLITFENENGKLAIQFKNSTLTETNIATMKFLTVLLMNIKSQSLFDGEIVKDRITISLDDVVKSGMYQNIDSATKGAKQFSDFLLSLRICYEPNKKWQKQSSESIEYRTSNLAYDFYKMRNTPSIVVSLNKSLNWGDIVSYLSLFHMWALSLSPKAFILYREVFYIARANAKKNTDTYEISVKKIAESMMLPIDTKNPQRDIIDVIESAIVEIEDKAVENGCNDFYLEFSNAEMNKYNARKILNNGKLKLILRGEFADNFSKAGETRAEKVEESMKREKKIIDTAKATAISRKIDTSK